MNKNRSSLVLFSTPLIPFQRGYKFGSTYFIFCSLLLLSYAPTTQGPNVQEKTANDEQSPFIIDRLLSCTITLAKRLQVLRHLFY